jgi:predicted nucleic acid-binding protein
MQTAIVADSSYLVHGLLKDASLLEDRIIIDPDLVIYEVSNAILKHETILRDISNGKRFLQVFYELIAKGTVRLVRPNSSIALEAFQIALQNKCTIYDAVFVALLLHLGVALQTYDEFQKNLAESLKHKRR